MDSIVIISAFLVLIFFVLFIGAPVKLLRLLGQGAIKIMIGALFLFFLNAFGTAVNIHIPINVATASVSGFLGLPGVAALVAIDQLIL